MKSLLTRFQSCFKASYGGRYFEHILFELSHDAPDIINAIFNLHFFYKPQIHSVRIEYPFKTLGRKRIADIAIVETQTNTVVGLIEVKYEDERKDENDLQLSDYIRVSKKRSIPFVYLTQYFPPIEHYNRVVKSGNKHLLFSELGIRLQNWTRLKDNLASTFLINFFKDKGYMFSEIDETGLWKFMVRLFNPHRGQGKIRSSYDMVENIPSTLVNIMGNLSVINTEINRKFCGAIQTPTIDILLNPWAKYKIKDVLKLIEKARKAGEKELLFNIGKTNRAGGIFNIYAESSICPSQKSKPWVYFDYGFEFEINPKDKNVRTSVYAEISSPSLGERWIFKSKPIQFRKLSDKSFLIKELAFCIKNVLSRGINNRKIAYSRTKIKKIQKAFINSD